MSDRNVIIKQIDWFSIFIYVLLAFFGWVSIFSSSWEGPGDSLFSSDSRQLKQLIWIGFSFVMILIVMLLDSKFFSVFAFLLYGLSIFSLIAVLFLGKEVNGARSWFELGAFRFQPAEFAKIFTSLALAQLLTRNQFNLKKTKHLILAFGLMAIPMVLIIMQNDTGSALVYFTLILVLFREGMNSTYLIIILSAVVLFILSLVISPALVILGSLIVVSVLYWLNERSGKVFAASLIIPIAFGTGLYFLSDTQLINLTLSKIFTISIILSVLVFLPKMIKTSNKTALLLSMLLVGATLYINSLDYAYNNVLEQHQRDRIEHTLGLKEDPLGIGYNVNQSKIAIGSGGFTGKGFLRGTQTKFDFVPEQSTDFIFCTVGEEFGFVGTSIIVVLFMVLILRLIFLAERQRSKFSRVYGYAVVSILFFHVFVNIGMTIGIMPVIGIPLPFFSYGGSSFMAFSMFLFIFLRLDANRLDTFR